MTRLPARARSARWIVLVRFILYLVIVGFFFQRMYLNVPGGRGDFARPWAEIGKLAAAFAASLLVMAAGMRWRFASASVAAGFVIDIGVITGVVAKTGGFYSIFISFYLPLIFMGSSWLPPRFTAVFPSMAVLGLACVSLGYSRWMEASTIVATMLIFSVLFFVVAYLAGMLGQGLFAGQRLNATILEGMTEGVAVVTKEWRLAYVNSEFARIFPGARAGGEFAPVVRSLFPGADPAGREFTDAMPRSEDAVVTLEPPDAPPDGNGESPRPPVEARVSALRLSGGREPDGLLFVVTDLTLRRRVERAETGLKKHQAISAMAAGLAHEIRNPLASLRGAIQEVGKSFPPGSENRVLTDVVIAESDRLDGVVGRFLDFSREGKLRLANVRLSPLLADVKTMILRSDEGADVAVSIRAESDPEVNCDADRLTEVFFNLSLNACQHVPHPGGELLVTLREDGRLGRKGVEITFEDNGAGLGDKDGTRLFAPFYTTRSGGTGMGLAFSRKQMTMHNGTVDAENRRGGGAKFTVWLPVGQDGGGGISGRLLRRGGV